MWDRTLWATATSPPSEWLPGLATGCYRSARSLRGSETAGPVLALESGPGKIRAGAGRGLWGAEMQGRRIICRTLRRTQRGYSLRSNATRAWDLSSKYETHREKPQIDLKRGSQSRLVLLSIELRSTATIRQVHGIACLFRFGAFSRRGRPGGAPLDRPSDRIRVLLALCSFSPASPSPAFASAARACRREPDCHGTEVGHPFCPLFFSRPCVSAGRGSDSPSRCRVPISLSEAPFRAR